MNLTARGVRSAFALTFVAAWLVVTNPTVAQADPATNADAKPIRVVVLVDESGSLKPADVAREKEGAALIAETQFSTESQVAVVGFGSSNAPGQTPVDNVCRLTKTDNDADRGYLSECVDKLHARTEAEGNDTDFAKAMEQALSILNEPSSTPQSKLIFLLTDGQLDVHRSPSWGSDPSRRDAAALSQLHQDLGQAATQGVQVWPLGFGDQVDRTALAQFASLGSQAVCGPGAPVPSSRVVTSSSDVTAALFQAFAAARCSVAGPPQGGKPDMYLTIPPIATDASITVLKRDKNIVVTYYEPGSSTPIDFSASNTVSADDSQFTLNGTGTANETLVIVDPKPGQWHIHLAPPSGTSLENVFADVMWQGNVRSAVTVNPPQPAAGQAVTVAVTIQTRVGVIIDPAELSALSVSAQLTGDGFDTVPIALADNGQGGDVKAGDGQFSGTVTIPAGATGALELVGSVRGAGIEANNVPYDTTIYTGGPAINLHVTLVPPDRIAPGGTMSGTVQASNQTGTATAIRLVIANPSSGLSASVSPATSPIPGSGTKNVPFTITIGSGSTVGPARVQLNTVSDADPTHVIDSETYTFNVAFPPPWVQRHALLLGAIGAVIVIALVALLLYLRQRSRNQRVAGLSLALWRGERLISELPTADTVGKEFYFVIGGSEYDPGAQKLARATPSMTDTYKITRRANGAVRLLTPYGEAKWIYADVAALLADDMSLQVSRANGTNVKAVPPAPSNFRRDPQSATHGSDEPLAESVATSAGYDDYPGGTASGGYGQPTAAYDSYGQTSGYAGDNGSSPSSYSPPPQPASGYDDYPQPESY